MQLSKIDKQAVSEQHVSIEVGLTCAGRQPKGLACLREMSACTSASRTVLSGPTLDCILFCPCHGYAMLYLLGYKSFVLHPLQKGAIEIVCDQLSSLTATPIDSIIFLELLPRFCLKYRHVNGEIYPAKASTTRIRTHMDSCGLTSTAIYFRELYLSTGSVTW